jgi:hypothetical protein
MLQEFGEDVHSFTSPEEQLELEHPLSSGFSAEQELHVPLLLQVCVPGFIMRQEFAADRQLAGALPGVHVEPGHPAGGGVMALPSASVQP